MSASPPLPLSVNVDASPEQRPQMEEAKWSPAEEELRRAAAAASASPIRSVSARRIDMNGISRRASLSDIPPQQAPQQVRTPSNESTPPRRLSSLSGQMEDFTAAAAAGAARHPLATLFSPSNAASHAVSKQHSQEYSSVQSSLDGAPEPSSHSAPPVVADGAATPDEEEAGHADALASFRPPSPANVVHVLERHRVSEEDSEDVLHLQDALERQGDELVTFRMPAELEHVVKMHVPVPLPIVPQLLSFFHHHVEPPPKHHRRRGSRNSASMCSHRNGNSADGNGTNNHSPTNSGPASRQSPRTEHRSLGDRAASLEQALQQDPAYTISMSVRSSISSSHSSHSIHADSFSVPQTVHSPSPDAATSLEQSPSAGDVLASPVADAGATVPASSVLSSASAPAATRELSLPNSVASLSLLPPRVPSPAHSDSRGHSRSGTVMHDPRALSMSLPDNCQLLRDLLREYCDLYFENPRAFGAFYKKKGIHRDNMSLAQKADLVYHHLKGRESHAAKIEHPVKKLMERNKPRLLAYIEDLLAIRSLRLARIAPALINSKEPSLTLCVEKLSMMQTAGEDYLLAVNEVASRLREQYLSVRAAVDVRLSDVLDVVPHLESSDDLNLRILQVVFEPDLLAQISAYHAAYRQASSMLPGRILLSTLMRNRIESRTHMDDISFNDLIIAVEDSTAHLRKSIHGFMRVHPDLTECILQSELPSQLEQQPATPEYVSSVQKLGAIYKRALLGFLRASRIYPKLLSPAVFALLRKLQLSDITAFRLLSENRYMEALWRLHDLGLERQGDMLEQWMHKAVFNDNHVVKVAPLGGGFTTTMLMTLQADDAEVPGLTSHSGLVTGVYKPKPKASIWKLQSLADSIVSNHRKEVAAYRIDKLLHLNHVPLTKSMLWEEREGSLQIFVQNAVSARAMQELNMSKPQAPGKFSAPKGRSQLPRRIRLFDFLIDNRDRNLDNYLISSIDQRIVLIDHGWTFTTPKVANELTHYHNSAFLRSIIPHRRLYERCKWLNEHTQVIDAELQYLLSKDNLAAFKHRLKLFVNFVQDEIKHHGVDAVFAQADKEDCRGLCEHSISGNSNSGGSNSNLNSATLSASPAHTAVGAHSTEISHGSHGGHSGPTSRGHSRHGSHGSHGGTPQSEPSHALGNAAESTRVQSSFLNSSPSAAAAAAASVNPLGSPMSSALSS